MEGSGSNGMTRTGAGGLGEYAGGCGGRGRGKGASRPASSGVSDSDGVYTAAVEMDGVVTRSIGRPKTAEKAADGVRRMVTTASSAAQWLRMISCTSTRTLAACRFMTAASAVGKQRMAALRVAATSILATSPAAVNEKCTTDR